MRCLYCGNELALLKKLTGGGEFCSEAHRQKYQEEYNRLALSRLLQAQPPAAERRPLEAGKKAKVQEATPPQHTESNGSTSHPEVISAPPPARFQPASPPPPAPAPIVEDPVPAAPGFLLERFEPVLSPGELFSSEPFLAAVSAFLPTADQARVREVRLPESSAVALSNLQGGWKIAGRSAEGRLEPREFVRTAPSVDVQLGFRRPAPPRGADILMDIELPVQASTSGAVNWAPWQEFSARAEYRLNCAGVVGAVLFDRQPEDDLQLAAFSDTPEGTPVEADVVDDAEPVSTSVEVPEVPKAPAMVETSAEEPVEAPIEAADPVPPMTEPEAAPSPVTIAPEPAPDVAEKQEAIDSKPDFHHEVVIDLSIFEEFEEQSEKKTAPEPRAPTESSTGESAAVEAEPEGAQPTVEPVPEPEAEPEPLEPQPAIAGMAPAVDAGPEPEPEPTAEPARQPEPPAPQALRVATALLEVDLQPAAAKLDVPVEVSPAATALLFRIALPGLDPVPVRSRMFYGRKPLTPKAPELDAGLAAEPEILGLASAPVPEPDSAPVPARTSSGSSRRESRRKAEKTVVKPPVPQHSKPSATLEPEPVAEPPQPAVAAAAPAEVPPPPAPAAKIEVGKNARPAPAPIPETANDLDEFRLNLASAQLGESARMTTTKRISVGVGCVVALAVAGFLLKSTFASKPVVASAGGAKVEAVGPSLVSSSDGWTADWSGATAKGPKISLLRPSISLSDYRIEFQGQIEGKFIGWIFRAASPKNYYVNRLEMQKAGLEPVVILAHYAVINGEETQRAESPLPFKVHLDTVYKVRTDVFGTDFKTYVQDRLVDSWSDDRLKTGGFGLMGDPGDNRQVRLIQVYGLRAAQ